MSPINNANTPLVDPRKEIRNQSTISMLFGSGMFALAWWLDIPVLIKLTFLVTGLATGFLTAVVRFNHWDEVIRHQYLLVVQRNHPQKPKNPIVGLATILLFVAGIGISVYAQSVFGDDVKLLGMWAFGLVFCAFGCDYSLEHLLLYQLYKLNKGDSQLPTPDDPM